MSEDDVIAWSPDTFLSWSDFKAEPHPATYQDAISQIKYNPTWKLISEKMGKDVFFKISDVVLKTQFLKNLSWVKAKFATEKLLEHQQGFFDLAEELRPLITDKIAEKFYNKKYLVRGSNEAERLQYAQEDSATLIRDLLDKLYEEIYLKEAQNYESETEYGENEVKQESYNFRFSKLHTR